jgi:CRP-like cAMP-binding protein
MAVGATTNDIEVLAEPVSNRLFFAGEATYAHHWAAVPGAYMSGLREAARISGDNSIMPTRHFTENRRWRDMMLRMTRFFNSVTSSTDQAALKSREEILSQSEVFSVVPANELKVLAAMFTTVNFNDGQEICRVGDRATQVYAILEGQIEVQLGDGSVADMLKPGDVVGEYGMFGGQRRTATLVSRGPSSVLTLDYPRFKRFLLAFPESTLALLGITTSKMVRQINANRTGKFEGELDPFGLIDEDTLY